jgi:predicted RNA binding protein YcfA (HicA-like mRNA interferase family)
MGQRKYPPLTPSQVEAIVKALGFIFKRQIGSHKHYERAADTDRNRAVVTIDMAIDEFWKDLIKSMIRQSGFTREQFYGATPKTAKKI